MGPQQTPAGRQMQFARQSRDVRLPADGRIEPRTRELARRDDPVRAARQFDARLGIAELRDQLRRIVDGDPTGDETGRETGWFGDVAVECVLHGVARAIEREPDAARQREFVGRWVRIAAELFNQFEFGRCSDDEGGQILERRIGLTEIDRRRAFDADGTQRAIGVESPDFLDRPWCVRRCRPERGGRAECATEQTHVPLARFDLHLEVAIGLEARRDVTVDAGRYKAFGHCAVHRHDAMTAGDRQIDERVERHRHAIAEPSIHAHRQCVVRHRAVRARRFAEPQLVALDQRLRDRRAVDGQLQQAMLARQRNRIRQILPDVRARQRDATRREVDARAIVEPCDDCGPAGRTHICRPLVTTAGQQHVGVGKHVDVGDKAAAGVRQIDVERAQPRTRPNGTVIVAGRAAHLGVAIEHPAAPRFEHCRNVRIGGAGIGSHCNECGQREPGTESFHAAHPEVVPLILVAPGGAECEALQVIGASGCGTARRVQGLPSLRGIGIGK